MNTEYENNLEFVRQKDAADPLKTFRDKFYIPWMHGRESIYLTGNSLGLQPKSAQDYVVNELEDWANYGVEGHFHARNPWLSYHEILSDQLAQLAGALPHEVVAMNQLTVNIHLLFATFYRPSKDRFKIICEAKAFPSDQYALESQVALKGHKYDEAVVEISPRPGEHLVREEDILEAIESHKDSLALVFIGGVNYYSGQVFDMQSITKAAHEAGALCGFDLAHAIGNVPLELHNWQCDFATWCSYKYLNSGPGAVSGVYIHEKWATDKSLPRFAGWWGHDKDKRFKMPKGFDPIPTAEGWQLSNAPVLNMAAHKAALDMFSEAGIENIFEKGKDLSGYLRFVLDAVNEATGNRMNIITPKEEKARGCQVSLLMDEKGKAVFESLLKNSIIADWREPNVIRVAPVPLYNSFEDVHKFGLHLKNALSR